MLFCTDRGIGITDEMFRILHMLLISNDDARVALVDYLTKEANFITNHTQNGLRR